MHRMVLRLSIILQILIPAAAFAQNGHFSGTVDAVWMADGRHMLLNKPITFVDSAGKSWPVPAGTETDGASIPQSFWWLIGGPFEGKYREAAVIHDFYCDTRRRSWQDVDLMFYDAMLSSGVDETKAKAMFFAVWAYGPRWDDQTLNNVWLLYPKEGGPDLAVNATPGSLLQASAIHPAAYYEAMMAESSAAHANRTKTKTSLSEGATITFAPKGGSGEHNSNVAYELKGVELGSSLNTQSNDPQEAIEKILAENPNLKEIEMRAEAAHNTAPN